MRVSFVHSIITRTFLWQIEHRISSFLPNTRLSFFFSTPQSPSLALKRRTSNLDERQNMLNITPLFQKWQNSWWDKPGWRMKKAGAGGWEGHKWVHRCGKVGCYSQLRLPIQQPLIQGSRHVYVVLVTVRYITSYNELKERGWPVAKVTTWFYRMIYCKEKPG